MGRNIAFKCTYNDGSKKGQSEIGFNGTCSDEIIEWNIERNKVWCNEGPCKDYYKNNFEGSKPESPCYESKLFTKWKYDAGYQHKNQVQPLKIKQAGRGHLALLTTRLPGDEEKDRKIFGFYKIAEIKNEKNGQNIATQIIAGNKYRIRLTAEEAEKLHFWDFYSNPNSSKKIWGSGLFRYFDMEVIDILNAAKKAAKNKDKKQLISELHEYFSEIYEI